MHCTHLDFARLIFNYYFNFYLMCIVYFIFFTYIFSESPFCIFSGYSSRSNDELSPFWEIIFTQTLLNMLSTNLLFCLSICFYFPMFLTCPKLNLHFYKFFSSHFVVPCLVITFFLSNYTLNDACYEICAFVTVSAKIRRLSSCLITLFVFS